MIIFVILYIGLCYGVASFVGSDRKIGFGSSFVFCLLLSPIIGWLITLAYPKVTNTSNPLYDLLLRNAMEEYNKGNLTIAKEKAKAAILRSPNRPNAYLRLGAFYAKEGNIDKAILNVSKSKQYGIKSLVIISKEPFDSIRKEKKWIDFVDNGYIIKSEKTIPSDTTNELEKIAGLFEKGLLTEEEFKLAKKQALDKS